MRRLRDLFTTPSRARYLFWRASRTRSPVEATLASGERLILRPPPSTDLLTAYEIFVSRVYEPPQELPPLVPSRVVDLGANVGYTILLWSKRFPSAHIVAFEPHPAHLELLYGHVVRNRLEHRVEIVGAAASNRSGSAFLAAAENESHVVDVPSRDTQSIRLTDYFAEVGPRADDLLKMDIEGGEFELLNDDRFGANGPNTIVLEWHNTSRTPDGKLWCTRRLEALGYRVARGAAEYKGAGVIWAWKPVGPG